VSVSMPAKTIETQVADSVEPDMQHFEKFW
jgi:hypothetical protein